MSIISFQDNSPGWQFELGKQQLKEWWELKISQLEFDAPDLSVFDLPLMALIVKFILWSLIAVILVWLTWQIWLILRPIIRNWRRQSQKFQQSFKKVPNQIQLSPQEWLGKAKKILSRRKLPSRDFLPLSRYITIFKRSRKNKYFT